MLHVQRQLQRHLYHHPSLASRRCRQSRLSMSNVDLHVQRMAAFTRANKHTLP